MKGLTLACAFCAFVTIVAVAMGQDPRSIRLDYEVPASCPDQRTFEAQVRARSSRIAVGANGATPVRVRIAPRGARFEGEVTIPDASGHDTRRSIEGGCADVVSALALIAALALDPTASTAREPPPTASASSAPAPPPAPSAAPPAPSTAPAPPPPVPAPASPPAEAGRDRSSAAPHAWAWSLGAHAGITGGVTPDLLFSVPVFFDVSLRTKDVFAPALRLRFERSSSGGPAASSGSATFTWTTGSVDVCPVAWAPGPVRMWPCARVQGGTLEAAGVGVTPARSSVRPWISAGLEARARLAIVGPLFAELEGGAFVPIVRDRFFVEPSATIHQAPIVAATGSGGLGVSFW